MKRRFSSFIQNNHNYWQIDKIVYQLLGPTTTILLSEYILQSDLEEDNHFSRTRKQIEKSTGIERTVQFRTDQKLVALKLLKIDSSKKSRSRILFTLRKKNLRKFLSNPFRYVAKLQHNYELLKLVKELSSVAKSQHQLVHVAKSQHRNNTTYYLYNNILFTNIKDISSFINSFKKELETFFASPQKVVSEKKDKIKGKTKIVSEKLIIGRTVPEDCKFKIDSVDFLLYDELTEIGATKHRLNTKAYAFALDTIHRLLSDKCKLPYLEYLNTNNGKQFDKKYKSKKWEVKDVVEAFKFYLDTTEGKQRGIASFIFVKNSTTNVIYSPLVLYHSRMIKAQENRKQFNGTAKKIYNFVKERIGEPTIYSNSIFIRAGKLVEKTKKHYVANPSLIPPEDTMEFQFIQYLGERLRHKNFKLPFIATDVFIEQFLFETEKNRKIVKKSEIGRY